MRVGLVVLAAVGVLLASVPAQAQREEGGSSAGVAATWACNGDVTVSSQRHAISNIIVAYRDGEQKVEEPFATADVFEYVFAAADYPGLTGVYVKAGKNGTRGKGTLVPLPEPVCAVDADGDGHSSDVDCDDGDPSVYPGAPEVVNDGIDQDCDGSDLVVGSGDIRVTLQWTSTPSESVDMDLYVQDPNGDWVYWANPSVLSGGTLDRDDDQCGHPSQADGQSIENIHWPAGSAISGTYTVDVHEYGICVGNTGGSANWTVQVFVHGVLVLTESGTGDLADPLTFAYP
jgi:hypothetical protein